MDYQRHDRASRVPTNRRPQILGRMTKVKLDHRISQRLKTERPSQRPDLRNRPLPRAYSEKRQRSSSRSSYRQDGSKSVKRRRFNEKDTTSGTLCHACAQIDWSALEYWLAFEGIMTWRGKPIFPVGKRFRCDYSDSSCPLCRQLSAPWIEPFLKHQSPSYQRRAEVGDEIHVFRNLRHIPHVNDFPTSLITLRKFNAPFHIAVVPLCGGWKEEMRTHVAEHGMVVVWPADGHPKTEVFAPKQVPKLFSPEIVSPWLGRCREHQRLCNPKSPKVDGMKVIDCRPDRPVVQDCDTDCKYVALSYVWGAEAEASTFKLPVRQDVNGNKAQRLSSMAASTARTVSQNVEHQHQHTVKGEAGVDKDTTTSQPKLKGRSPAGLQLPRILPRTIRDAVKVTRELGFNFLWVDKYCIDQNNEEERHRQCSQMGSIYSGAQITIFALGKNFESGLPGVSSPRPHWQYQHTTIGRYTFVYTLPDPQYVIKHSKWSTRAWTYQEGLFSTRRLFFTKHQLYYECNAMNCTESFASDLKHLHILSGQRFRAFNRAGNFVTGNSNQFSHYDIRGSAANHRKVDIIRRCEFQTRQYTKRELTKKDDVLHAFAGIAHFYANTTARLYNLAGLFIPYPIAQLRDIGPEYLDHLSYALAWTHRSRRAITFDMRNPRIRRGFPSWSWAGWEGELHPRLDYPFCWSSHLSSVKIEFRGGETKEYEWLYRRQPQKQYLRDLLASARVLYLKAHLLDASKLEFWCDDPDRIGRQIPSYQIHWYMSKGPDDWSELHRMLLKGRYQLAVLGTHAKPRDEVFRAIKHADKKGAKAKNRRIELLRYKEPGALLCLVLYHVKGSFLRAGLVKLALKDTNVSSWDLGEKQEFRLI